VVSGLGPRAHAAALALALATTVVAMPSCGTSESGVVGGDASADSSLPDAATADGPSSSDARITPTNDAGGDFGTPCTSDVQCSTGVCLSVGRCTKPCAGRSDCPPAPEWQCSPAATGGGATYCQCHPSGAEVCDGRDNDCDGIVDDGATCPTPGEVCQAGSCVCPPANVCAGTCVDYATNASNCGMCGHKCPAVCAGSACVGISGVCAGDDAVCAMSTDGVLRCWGPNANGDVGDGTTATRWAPVTNGLGSLKLVACGSGVACAERTDRTVRCWGSPLPGSGALGSSPIPTVVPEIEGATSIAIGVDTIVTHACALLPDATIACWGSNIHMQLGFTTTETCPIGVNPISCSRKPQVVPGVTSVRQVAVGAETTCVVHTNSDLECWGSANYGALGDGSSGINTKRGPNGVSVLGNVSSVALSNQGGCALMLDGTVKCWGWNAFGQLGVLPVDGACGSSCQGTPTAIPGLTGVAQLAMGNAVGCARMLDGSVRCWGADDMGQAGGGASDQMCNGTKCVVPPASVLNVAGAKSVAVSGSVSFAVLSDGSLVGWGDGTKGLLGTGNFQSGSTPASPAW
jgi:alpha-tubulin suppressor-like RCC1 family protein